MGFGHSTPLHTAEILRLSEDLPIVIEIVDSEDKVKALLPFSGNDGSGLVTLERVQVLRYGPNQNGRPNPAGPTWATSAAGASALSGGRLPAEGAVHRVRDTETARPNRSSSTADVVHAAQLLLLPFGQLGLLALSLPRARATAMPSRVAAGSGRPRTQRRWPGYRRTSSPSDQPGHRRSTRRELDAAHHERVSDGASIRDQRARRSSLGTTSVSPVRTPASAWSRPGRAPFAPVSPRSM